MKTTAFLCLFFLSIFVGGCSTEEGQKNAELYQKIEDLENKSGSLQKQVDAIVLLLIIRTDDPIKIINLKYD